MNNFDDKTLVIMAALLICLAVIFAPSLSADKSTIVSSIITGLFGVAIGRASK